MRGGAARTGLRRWLSRLAAVVIGLGLTALIGLGIWRRPAFTPPIAGPNSIASLEVVSLGGARQWILIRGEDRTKPIVLFLHGGPGAPLMGLSHAFQRPLERDFVVVQWDRRGSGKSFGERLDPKDLSTTREAADAVELIGMLRRRLGPQRVILVGQDYGAYLGAMLTQAHPELVRALVAAGMPACTTADVDAIQDSWLRSRAAPAGDGDTTTQATVGGKWDRPGALYRYGGVLVGQTDDLTLRLALITAPEYRLPEALDVDQGMALVQSRLRQDGPAQPLARSIPALDAPFYVLLGRRDYVTPAICADRYADLVQAPIHQEIWFERSAHYPFLEEPVAFHKALLRIAAETEAWR